MENETEQWVPIPSIPGAQASTMGRIWFPPATTANGVIYKTKPRTGSEEVTATGRSSSGRRRILRWRGKTYKVHTLICEAFHGPKPFPTAVVLHLNEEPSDNRKDNLRWGTRKENQNFPKAVAAFKARTGDKSPWAIHQKRKSA